MKRFIGYSKFAILDKSGKYYIVNEDKGNWSDGVWYSNTSYKEPKKTKTETKTYSYYDDWYDDDYYYNGYYNTYKSNHIANTYQQKLLTNNKSYGIIYKCRDCGKEIVLNEYETKVCDVCKSYKLDEIGYRYGYKNYYYDVSKK